MNDIIRTLQFEKEQLEARIRILADKLESDNRQISEYDHELRQAKRLLKAAVENFDSIYCRLGDDCEPMPDCDVCPFIPSRRACYCNWRYADEALALIGEEGGNNA